MKLAIVGSRVYPDLDRVRRYVRALPLDTVIVSGGAKGVDLEAELTARARGMTVEIYRVTSEDWRVYGKGAGMRRNSFIVAACDQLVAFHDGTSKGTADSIAKARAAGKLREVILPGDDEP